MRPYVVRKSPFTLLEVLISFSLLAFILGLIFTHFRSTSILNTKTEKVKSLALTREHLYERLSILFSKIESSEKFFIEEGTSGFYTEETSKSLSPKELYFGIKHSIDKEIAFSSYVLGKLFVDEHKTLTLELRPFKKEDSHKIRIEKLLPSVKGLSFTFYKIKKDNGENSTTSSSFENFEVLDRFELKEKNLPYALTITLFLEEEETPIKYTFFISSQIDPIPFMS